MTLKILYDIPEHRMRDAIKSYTIELKNSNTIKDPVFVNFCKKLLEKRTKFFEKETPENFSWLSQHRYILNDSTIIIYNIPNNIDENLLQTFLQSFGPIKNIRIKPMPYGDANAVSVYFQTRGDAQKAIENLNNNLFNGNTLRAHFDDDDIKDLIESGQNTIKITGLDPNITASDLQKLFSTFGKILTTYIPTNNGKSLGEAYIQFYDKNSASIAIDHCNNQYKNGRIVEISYSPFFDEIHQYLF